MLPSKKDMEFLVSLPGEIFVQPKLDGFRCRMLATSNGCKLLSSQENIITSVPLIQSALNKHVVDSRMSKIVELDGELLIPGERFTKISSILSRKENLHFDHTLIQYHVFDCITDVGTRLAFEYRWDALEIAFPTDKHHKTLVDRVYLVPTYRIKAKEIPSYLSQFLGEGFEGIIVRLPLGAYKRARSNEIFKYKPIWTMAVTIRDSIEEKSLEGIPKNSLGAFVCQLPTGETFNVGTGPILTKEGRADLWDIRSTLPDKRLLVQYQELSEYGIPRFPVAIEILQMEDLLT